MRVRTRVELAELHQRLGSTMIYVTHDQTEAMTLADRIVVLNDCRIEQVGTPMEVCDRPATRFVARFIGSPAMNLLPVFLSHEPGGVVVRSGVDPVLTLPADPAGQGPWTLGVRPEALRVAGGLASLGGTATLVERLGDRTLVHLRLDEGETVVAQDGGKSPVRAGDRVGLDFDAVDAHLFDGAGQAVRRDVAA